ncbi:8950_t:CDS:2, partial [Acaulospora morrowiae]
HQINATSAIYLGMKEDRWIPQTELRSIVDRVVTSASNVYMEGSSRQLRILRISPQFDIAFEGVCALYDMGAIKTDVEKPLSSDQIKNNVDYLKRKLGNDTSPLYQRLYSDVNEISVHNLTWKDPLASQVISDTSTLVQNLPGNLKKAFMVCNY